MKKSIISLFTILAVLLMASCSKKEDVCNINAPGVRLEQQDELKAYIEKHHPDAVYHSLGFYYEIIAEGNARQAPDGCSEVRVNYSGALADGTEFDKATNVLFNLRTLIPGWRLALPLIREGGIISIVLPADLAYGDTGIDNIIPKGAITVFKIELLEVR